MNGSATECCALWVRFRAGDADALGQLAERHYRPLYNYGLRFGADSEFVRDCIQDVWLDLWDRRTHLADITSVRAYLLTALRNKLLKESLKAKRLRAADEMLFADLLPYEPVESILIADEHQQQQIRQLQTAIQHLTKREQEIVYLRFYQQLAYDDIARIMDIKRESVANLMFHTLNHLRQQWQGQIICHLPLLYTHLFI